MRRSLLHLKSIRFILIVFAVFLFHVEVAKAAIVQRGSSTSATTNNSILTISKPGEVVAGDIMIVNICQTGNVTDPPILTGWTLIAGTNHGGSPNIRYGSILYKISDGTEGSSFTFNLGAGVTDAVGSIVAFSGVSGVPFDVTPGSINTGLSYSATATAISTITANTAILFLGQSLDTSWSSWSGTNPTFTEIMDVSSSNVSVAAAWGIFTGTGTTGNRTATLNVSNAVYSGAILIALKPDLCVPPTVQASNVSFTSTGTTGTTINWTRGNGTGGVIVVGRLTSTTEVYPTSGTTYNANSVFGSGNTTGVGNFVIYKGTGTSIPVTGLASGSNYTFTVYEYNTASNCYNIPGSSAAVSTICTPPTTQATMGAFTNNTTGTSLTVNWTRGNGNRVVVVARSTSTAGIDPSSGITYTANAAFGSGNTTGPDNFVVYSGTGTSVNVTGLTMNTNYTFTVYEYNTTGPCYKTPGSSAAVTTPLVYCAIDFSSNTYPINNVTFSDLNNSSCNTENCDASYVDYSISVSPANVISGQQYTITTGGFTRSSRTMYYRVYFDWDQNGVFTGTDESYDIGSKSDGGNVSLPITIPATAKLGNTRMRVTKSRNQYTSSSCGTFTTNGQAEDYTITVLPACVAVGNPTVFGTNAWNVYAYQGSNIDLSGITYKGYYTEPNVSFSTIDRWSINGSPDEAANPSNYQGCEVTDDNHTFVYKREGFPSGTYQITIGHDDSYQLYLDNTLIGSSSTWDSNTPVVLSTTYTLSGTSKIEFRVAEITGSSRGALTFTPQCTNPTNGGTITGLQTICSGGDPSAFTSSAAALGQTGTLEYKWQSSITSNGSGFSDITGATGLTYDVPSGLIQTTWYRRLARVACAADWSGAVSSNILEVTVNALPSAPIAVNQSKTYTGIANTTSISATAGSGETIDWYNSATGGTLLVSGSVNYTPTAVNTGTYTYYAEARNSSTGCVSSSRTAVTLAINKAVLTVTANPQTVAYSTAISTVTGAGTSTITGYVNSENSSVISGTILYSTNYTASTAAGTSGVTITPVVTGLSSSNYTFTAVNGTITVSKAFSTINVTGNATYTYNGSAQGPANSTVTGSFGAVTYIYSGTGSTTYSTGSTRPTDAGTYQVVATVAADANYNSATSSAFAFTINPAPLTVTANDQTKIYGAVALTTGTLNTNFTVSGVVGSDAVNSIILGYSGDPSGDMSTASVGSYTITPSSVTFLSGTVSNYSVTYNSGTLTVNKALLTVTANNKTKVYDSSVYNGFTVSYSGFVNGETSSVLGGTLSLTGTATTAKNVGTGYVITPSGLTSANYNISFVNGTLTITARPITITADAKSKEYGSADPELTYQITSGAVVPGDSPVGTLNRASGESAGNYTINKNTLTYGSNYIETYVSADLTITQALLTVTANNKTKVYDGSVYNGFTVTYSGFVNGETSSVLGGVLGFSGTATIAKNVGSGYVIAPGGLTSANYSISFINGTLDITRATLVPHITANDKCFDGNSSAILSSKTLSGIISPDVVTLEVGSVNFSSAIAGSGKTVTASGLYLSGSGAGNYSLLATTATTSANINALPEPTITGDTSPCDQTVGVIYITEAGMSGYNWTISSGGTITSGAGTNTITVTWFVPGAQSVSVNYRNSSLCTAETATNTPVTVTPLPTSGEIIPD